MTADDIATYSYLCIGCPLGCRLELDEDADGTIVEIRGSSCRRGDRYAEQEHTDPAAAGHHHRGHRAVASGHACR